MSTDFDDFLGSLKALFIRYNITLVKDIGDRYYIVDRGDKNNYIEMNDIEKYLES